MNTVAQYSYQLDSSNNELLGALLDKSVFDILDDGPLDTALAKLPCKQKLKLEAEINSVLGDHIDAAFTLGWEAAKNPGAWLFDERGCLTQESPSDIFSEKMQATGLGFEDVFNLEGELGRIVVVLFTRAEELAFALGWELQHKPDSLVFRSHSQATRVTHYAREGWTKDDIREIDFDDNINAFLMFANKELRLAHTNHDLNSLMHRIAALDENLFHELDSAIGVEISIAEDNGYSLGLWMSKQAESAAK